MITVTERAAARLQEVLATRDVPEGLGVKLAPQGPRSVGLTLAAPAAGDEVVRYQDAPVLTSTATSRPPWRGRSSTARSRSWRAGRHRVHHPPPRPGGPGGLGVRGWGAGGAPDSVVRTVTENGRTLKFSSQGFERDEGWCCGRSASQGQVARARRPWAGRGGTSRWWPRWRARGWPSTQVERGAPLQGVGGVGVAVEDQRVGGRPPQGAHHVGVQGRRTTAWPSLRRAAATRSATAGTRPTSAMATTPPASTAPQRPRPGSCAPSRGGGAGTRSVVARASASGARPGRAGRGGSGRGRSTGR